MKIINKIVNKVTQKRLQQIEFFRNNPGEVQLETFKYLLNSAKDTSFGREHRFSDILKNKSFNSYTKYVPVRDYEQIKPYIDKIRKGENNVLWNTPIKWFAISSGTTSSKSKFIPVSKEALEMCHFRGGKDIIALYSNLFPDTKIVKSKSLVIGGSQQINSLNNKQFYGDLSAVIIDNLPIWTHFLRTPHKDVALMPEWEEKLEKMAVQSVKENVTSITGVPSWTLVLLKRILELTKKETLVDVWPDFEVFFHGGVSFKPYISEYEKIMPEGTRYVETYNASEGFFGIQDDLSSDDMLLMLDLGIYYEFIPLSEIEIEDPTVLTITEVELDTNYAMVISTNGGLWRYLIGDTVKFTSLKPHKIKISGRVKHFINAFGEELIIDNAERALKAASEMTEAYIKEYTAAPIYMSENNTGGHEWIIEFSKLPTNLELFKKTLDEVLKEINSDYAAKRHKNLTLQEPLVHIAKENLFYTWLKEKGKLGGQNKVPRLSNSRLYIDQLLQLNKS